MWHNNGKYSFTQPLKANGKATRYLSVLSLIDNEGPMKKYDILKRVWGVKGSKELYRGHMSTTFSALHHLGVLDYNRKTYKWSLTNKGKQILEHAKSEWGRRYADVTSDFDERHISTSSLEDIKKWNDRVQSRKSKNRKCGDLHIPG